MHRVGPPFATVLAKFVHTAANGEAHGEAVEARPTRS